MSTIDHSGHAHPPHGHDHHDESYLASRGSFWANVWNWATTIDHKKIGVMYLFAVMFMFFLGGVAALALRFELLFPVRQVTDAQGVVQTVGQFFKKSAEAGVGENNDIYNRLFTLHGAIMVFMFIIPSVPAALGNFFLPIMIGAKDREKNPG